MPFGVTQKISAARQAFSLGHDWSDTAVQTILQRHDWDISRAADDFLSGPSSAQPSAVSHRSNGLTWEADHGAQQAASFTPSPAPMSIDRGEPSATERLSGANSSMGGGTSFGTAPSHNTPLEPPSAKRGGGAGSASPTPAVRSPAPMSTNCEDPLAAKRPRDSGTTVAGGTTVGGGTTTLPEPFLRASLAAGGSEGTAALSMLLLQRLNAVDQTLKELQLQMPKELASAVPAAVRAHDEAEAARVREAAQEGALSGKIRQIQLAATMSELGKVEGFTFDAMRNRIVCDNCARYSSFCRSISTDDCGAIEGVDVTLRDGPNKDGGKRQRRPMSVVRYSCKTHLLSDIHEWCETHAAERRALANEQQAAGMTCAKLVLQNVKEHHADHSYERKIANAVASGQSVGTKQHSRKFVPRLRACMHKVLVSSFMLLLTTQMAATGRPPPFALMADKATMGRKTGQMCGIILMIEGVFVAIFLSVLQCGEAATGDALADLLLQTLTGGLPLDLSQDLLRLSFTGAAFDGQYQGQYEGHACGLDVLSHLCTKLKLNASYVMSRWDGAHRIELGMNTVRDKFPVYKQLAATISDVHTKYLYGKGFGRVCKAVSDFKKGLELAAVGSVCTTRFAHSERKVYKNFLRNLPVFITDMRTERAREVGIDQQIRKVASVAFVVTLMVIVDLLQTVKNLSLGVPIFPLPPWNFPLPPWNRACAFP